MVKLIIKVDIFPTEDEDKVIRALSNLFDLDKMKSMEKEKNGIKTRVIIVGSLDMLNKLKNKIAMRQIQIHVRQQLINNRMGTMSHLYLNKQAAFANNINICETRTESALGPIILEIHGDTEEDLDFVIYWLSEESKSPIIDNI